MSMKALPDELDFQSVFLAIEKTEGEVYGNQCRNSLDNMLKSADEDVTNKIIHVVQRVGEKVRGHFRMLLLLLEKHYSSLSLPLSTDET